MEDKLTDKDIEDAMKKMSGAESPNSMPVHPEMSQAIWKTINIVELMGGTIHIAFDDETYKIKVSKASNLEEKT